MFTTALLSFLAYLTAAQAWFNVDQSYPLLMPKIQEALDVGFPIADWQIRRQEHLGIYHERSVPIYLRHLSDAKNAGDYGQIFLIMMSINRYTHLFLPHAIKGLGIESQRGYSILYLTEYGKAKEANAVAALLNLDKLSVADTRQVLTSLRSIGGREEIVALNIFVARALARNPKLNWAKEVEPCIKAIEARLEAEAKAAALKK